MLRTTSAWFARQRSTLSRLALGGFALSGLIHILSLLGINVRSYVPWVWALHVGALALVIILGFAFFPVLSPGQRWRMYLAPLPPSARWWLGVCFVYGMLNFGLFFLSPSSHDGVPAIRDGQYLLLSQGRADQQRVIRTLTKAEYDWREAQILRMFSGHWMLFYLLPGLYYRYAPSEKRP